MHCDTDTGQIMTLRERILDILATDTGMCSAAISAELDIKVHSVCKAIAQLLDEAKAVVVRVEMASNGKPRHYYALPRPFELQLAWRRPTPPEQPRA